MGLKPDHWIRKMAREYGMIEPYEDKQVREGSISFGVSSYGYDIRVADEFKIFTPNPYNTVVDPKNLDERSLVPFKGDVCIIPPNSFALAVTVEYFRIPRSVLTLTVGKSTYARCFRGDTRVALVDGTSPTLEEMAKRAENGEMFWGYSIGSLGRIIVTLLEAPRYIGRDSLIEVVLDNNEPIYCTPDHIFLTRDGRLVEANTLRPGDSLMPLYRKLHRGYEMVYQPINGHLVPTHRLSDEWNLRNGIYSDIPNTHRHHIDHDRLNNIPWNIERMDAGEHIRHHNAETFGEDFDPEEHSLAVKEAYARLSQDNEWRKRFSESQRRKTRQFWDDPAYEEQRKALIQKRQNWSDEWHANHSAALLRYYADPEHLRLKSEISKRIWEKASEARRDQQREIARKINLRPEITSEMVWHALTETGSVRGAARLLNCDRATFRRFPEVMTAFEEFKPLSGAPREDITQEMIRSALDQTGSIRGAARLLGCSRSVFRRYPEILRSFKGLPERNNHKVQSVRELPGDHDVYCLTVPEAGNFALETGVFVSNCGIITNVTPFEPGWQGHVTLEISNTTPLPAKIYANEGIAQVLFFEADEECEISYADRQGKYQKQTGITLPKI